MSESVVIAVDIGSSSVRASLYSASGDPVPGSMASAEHSLRYTPDGGATLDPAALLDNTARVMDEALGFAGSRDQEVVCVAFDTLWHSLLGLRFHDGEHRPTTPVLTWADRRAAGSVAELKSELDERDLHRRTGCVLHSSYWPAKLRWLREAEPDAFRKTTRWVSPGEYLFLRFFGETGVGTSMASATGVFDHRVSDWDGEVLSVLGVSPGALSGISDEPHVGLSPEWAKRWPSLKGVPWYPAVGDGASSNIGSGCVGLDRVALMVGTSGAMRVSWKTDGFEAPFGTWVYRASRERYVAGGALSDGGNLISWLRNTLRLPGPEETEKRLAEMEPDAHGLTFLPLLAGERGPGWTDRANGVIAGLSMATDPVEVLRAAMEAVAMRFAVIHSSLDDALPVPTGSPGRRIIASGGGLVNSGVWRGIMADVIGSPITLSGVDEASSRGAVLLALESLGELSPEDAPAPEGETVEPDGHNHETYTAALDRQKDLYGYFHKPTDTSR